MDASRFFDFSGVGNYFAACAFRWPSSDGGCNTPGLVSGVESALGAQISTVSGVYRATSFSIALSPVPEPSAAALLLAGLALGAFRVRRRNV
ncbi:MAG: PEP-CTERM sorting domain-containing protein [Rhodocyclaceae bacterium]|nr:PEP-CTERM sorting domain-containing protein [Rhodocyclaceae bacterium]